MQQYFHDGIRPSAFAQAGACRPGRVWCRWPARWRWAVAPCTGPSGRGPAHARSPPRRRGDQPDLRAVVPILPAQCAVCRTRLPVQVERQRGVLRGAQRQQVGQRVSGEPGRGEVAKRSAGMPRVLRWAQALPSLRTLLRHRGLTSVDDQAIAFSLALAAYSPVSQSRTTTGLARRWQFFIHWIGLGCGFKIRALGSGQSTEGPNASTHPTVNVRARNKLPKGLSR